MNVQDYYQEIDQSTLRAAPHIPAHGLVSALILIIAKVIVSVSAGDRSRVDVAVEAVRHELDVEVTRMCNNASA